MPSVLYYDEDQNFIVGAIAVKQQVLKPDATIANVKRQIGETSQCISLSNALFTPSDISSEIIKALFNSIMNPQFCPEGVVVSVPYYFLQVQNDNTRLAVEKAIRETPQFKNTKYLGLIPEPVAAALSYAIDNMAENNDQLILTFDMGGGTLDLTILRLEITGSSINFEIMAVDGSDQFGGVDFDRLIESYIYQNEQISFDGLSERFAKKGKNSVLQGAKEAKEQLSIDKRHSIDIVEHIQTPISLDIYRSDFEKMLCGNNPDSRDFSGELLDILERLEQKARVSSKNIDMIMSVGGSTKIPFFQNLLTKRYPGASIQTIVSDDIHDSLFHSVAKGASIYAAYLLDKNYGTHHLPEGIEIRMVQRTCHHLGIRTKQNTFSIITSQNTIVPATETKEFYPMGYPDKSKTLASASVIDVYQGNSSNVYENTLIGKIKLPPIHTHKRPLNKIKIIVTFEVDLTELKVNILIPNSAADQTDIRIHDHIQLERRE
jgi:molecular chaperone DnaK (HSP70)